MLVRALLAWLALLVLAIANGAFREAVFTPRVGSGAAHVLSTLTLCALILLLTWTTIGWVHPRSARDAWLVGGLWVGLVVAFEFLAGHYLFGAPWSTLLADYDLTRGRIWVLVLVTTAVAPVVMGHARGLLRA